MAESELFKVLVQVFCSATGCVLFLYLLLITDILGLAVGLGVVGFMVFIIVPIATVVGIVCCVARCKRTAAAGSRKKNVSLPVSNVVTAPTTVVATTAMNEIQMEKYAPQQAPPPAYSDLPQGPTNTTHQEEAYPPLQQDPPCPPQQVEYCPPGYSPAPVAPGQ